MQGGVAEQQGGDLDGFVGAARNHRHTSASRCGRRGHCGHCRPPSIVAAERVEPTGLEPLMSVRRNDHSAPDRLALWPAVMLPVPFIVCRRCGLLLVPDDLGGAATGLCVGPRVGTVLGTVDLRVSSCDQAHAAGGARDLTRPWQADDDAGLSDWQVAATDQLLARTPEEHLRRAATIATNGANDAASRLLVIEHLLWAAVKGRLNEHNRDECHDEPLT